MLGAIGVGALEDMFADLPDKALFPDLKLPEGCSEMEVARELRDLAAGNVTMHDMPTFLGAGVYNHYVPAAVDHVLRRSEFYTSYTPYQPELSQGMLQAMFEYQSMICALTDMEVSNASHYDGATALAEAVLLALRAARGKRRKVIMSPPSIRTTVTSCGPICAAPTRQSEGRGARARTPPRLYHCSIGTRPCSFFRTQTSWVSSRMCAGLPMPCTKRAPC